MRRIKGQIAVEYIIFISVLLLFFQAIVFPNITFSENVVNDIYQATQTKQSVEKLANDISSFASSSGFGKRTVYFYLPSKGRIINCTDVGGIYNIQYSVDISPQNPRPPIANCSYDAVKNVVVCNYSKSVYMGGGNLTCPANIGPGYNGYLVIEKFNNGDVNVSFP